MFNSLLPWGLLVSEWYDFTSPYLDGWSALCLSLTPRLSTKIHQAYGAPTARGPKLPPDFLAANPADPSSVLRHGEELTSQMPALPATPATWLSPPCLMGISQRQQFLQVRQNSHCRQGNTWAPRAWLLVNHLGPCLGGSGSIPLSLQGQDLY